MPEAAPSAVSGGERAQQATRPLPKAPEDLAGPACRRRLRPAAEPARHRKHGRPGLMIEVEDLTKRYGRATAVDGVSFKVEKGEILGFLGPNGAGKTTTMRILTCYLPPTEGTARVAGFDVFEQPMEVKKRVGYMPGDAAALPGHGGPRRTWTSARRSRASPAKRSGARASRRDREVPRRRRARQADRPSSRRATASASGSPRRSCTTRTC